MVWESSVSTRACHLFSQSTLHLAGFIIILKIISGTKIKPSDHWHTREHARKLMKLDANHHVSPWYLWIDDAAFKLWRTLMNWWHILLWHISTRIFFSEQKSFESRIHLYPPNQTTPTHSQIYWNAHRFAWKLRKKWLRLDLRLGHQGPNNIPLPLGPLAHNVDFMTPSHYSLYGPRD